MMSERAGRKRTKYYKDRPEAVARRNKRLNAVSRLAYQIAGSSRKFYALPPEERAAIRSTAKLMHEQGQCFAGAQEAERTDLRGFVYVITNPAWPYHCKIGRAFDPESRLRGYQTGTPFRDYELLGARYFSNASLAEVEMHMRLAKWRGEGEWFRLPPQAALVEIDKLQEQLF